MPVLTGDSSRSLPRFKHGGDPSFHLGQLQWEYAGVSFLKTTPANAETVLHFGLADQLLSQPIFPPIWLLLFPQKNTGVQVPPLKPPETLAVPTVPPFPRFLKSVTHWMTDNRDR